MTPEELVERACPIIGESGGHWMFSPDTGAIGEALGFRDFFVFYVTGRGGALGDVSAEVVAAAKGFFAPELVANIWAEGRQVMTPPQAASAYAEACGQYGRQHLTAVENLGDYCDLANKILGRTNLAGYAMFAAWMNQPRADDPHAQAMQLTNLLREYRGGAHLCATLTHGVSPKHAVGLDGGPSRLKVFGWPQDTVADPETAEAHEAAERATSLMVLGAYSALSEAEADRFMAVLESIEAAIETTHL